MKVNSVGPQASKYLTWGQPFIHICIERQPCFGGAAASSPIHFLTSFIYWMIINYCSSCISDFILFNRAINTREYFVTVRPSLHLMWTVLLQLSGLSLCMCGRVCVCVGAWRSVLKVEQEVTLTHRGLKIKKFKPCPVSRNLQCHTRATVDRKKREINFCQRTPKFLD